MANRDQSDMMKQGSQDILKQKRKDKAYTCEVKGKTKKK